ncbi:peptidase M50 [Intrasporangium oryzae NRRL B-24470]|uniref:Peptidase M50 n=1 Tax=Intrasporangium oryzae NRRL B-24470 TaxID=1386089 RepID=W9G6B7_9MICO|nr:site-2 protease family protein [Intrasporangium oryzae]EWT00857.1 peptidase M50 [Intrasporangium oryzae NRRL B-24470]
MSSSARAEPSPGWRIGSLGGTPVYLGRSWPVIAVFIVVAFGPALGRADRGPAYGFLLAGAYALLLLVSVLVHEAAHALAARRQGHRVDRIVADVWGGHTVYDSTGATPGATALIAFVGPLSNLLLAGLGWVVYAFVTNETASTLLGVVTTANLLVGLFNLLPGLPMDGGQIVSSLVWKATGRRGTGLVVAGWLGRVVAIGTVAWFVARPLVEGRTDDLFGYAFPFIIGFFLWRGASGAIRAGQITEATASPAVDVLEPLLLVRASEPVSQVDRALADHLAGAAAGGGAGGGATWVAGTDAAGWPYAVLDADAAAAVPRETRASTPVSAVVVSQPQSWVVPLTKSAVLTDLVRVMSERSLSLAVVVDESTREVLGMATAERINAVVGAELARRGRR